MVKIQRRNFIKALGLLSISPIIQSCESSFSPTQTGGVPNRDRTFIPQVDILLDGTEEEISNKCLNQQEELKQLYNSPGKELKIGFLQNHEYNVIKLSFVKDNLASYPHLKIINTKTNEQANVVWGMDGIYPAFKFVDNYGNVIIKNGKSLEFTWKTQDQLSKKYSPSDWIRIGIKIFGVALLLWLGFTIGKYVLSALAFIAFNALVIGLVLAGIGLLIPIIRWILDITGITLESIIAILTLTLNEMIETLLDIMNYILQYVKV